MAILGAGPLLKLISFVKIVRFGRNDKNGGKRVSPKRIKLYLKNNFMPGPKTQKSAEEKIEKLIDEYNLSHQLKLSDIKKWIYNESSPGMEFVNKFQKKIFSFFNPDKLKSKDLDRILDTAMDAWNFLPHKSLGNKSPNQVAMESFKDFNKQVKETSQNKQDKPDIICGGRKIKWDDYWTMIAEMEKRQEPFKEWLDKDVLPKYKKFLEETVAKSKREDYYEVAEIFFERAMRLGFIELDEIRKDFIQKEFPGWWPTHIMFSNLKPKQVLVALQKLFEFLELVYNIDIKKFGF